MSLQSSSCLFHPPGRSPFGKHEKSRSHYFPTPTKDNLNKEITLIPQKVTHRNEYSLPPEHYSPEQYSFVDNFKEDANAEEDASLTEVKNVPSDIKWSMAGIETLPPESQESMQVKTILKQARSPVRLKTTFASSSRMSPVTNISKRLNQFRFGEPKPHQSRRKTSHPKHDGHGLKLTSTINNISRISDKSSSTRTDLVTLPRPSESRIPLSSTLNRSSSSLSSRDKDRLTTKQMQATEISSLLTRASSEPNLSSATSQLNHSEDSTASNKLSINIEEDPVINRLSSRLTEILQETESISSNSNDFSLPPDNFLNRPGSSESRPHETESQFSKLDRGQYGSTFPTNDTSKRHMSSVEPKQLQPTNFQPGMGKENYFASSSLSVPQKDATPIVPVSSYTDAIPVAPPEDDILARWRLRRKIEAARTAATYHSNKASSFRHPTHAVPTRDTNSEAQIENDSRNIPNYGCIRFKHPQNFTQQRLDEKNVNVYGQHGCHGSVGMPQTDVRSCVVHVHSSETQTTKSLEAESETSTNSFPGSPEVVHPTKSKEDSSVSFHKVKIVAVPEHDTLKQVETTPKIPDATPKSTNTPETDTTTWSSTNRIKPEKIKHKSTSSVGTESSAGNTSSPAGNAVKNVIGMRLFETPSSVQSKSTGDIASTESFSQASVKSPPESISTDYSPKPTKLPRNPPHNKPAHTVRKLVLKN